MDTAGQVQLQIDGLARGAAHETAAALRELIVPEADAVSVFEASGTWRVDAYYGQEAEAVSALEALKSCDPQAADAATITPVPLENWVALSQAALPPVFVGRFTVAGSHDRDRVPHGPNTLTIEAGEAFGTAHHSTTYGCLLALDRLTRRRAFHNVLDLGTGSGILALAIQRALPDASIIASDLDPRSIEVAAVNACHNGLPARAGGPDFIVADGVRDHRIRRKAPFDLVVANILAGPLIAMADDIARVLGADGTLVLSGILVSQAQQVAMRYRALGLLIRRHDRHDDWSTLVFEKAGRGRAAA
jgi:ribosomal protein L11 methyltransferase